jgi:hypothetical protein
LIASLPGAILPDIQILHLNRSLQELRAHRSAKLLNHRIQRWLTSQGLAGYGQTKPKRRYKKKPLEI